MNVTARRLPIFALSLALLGAPIFAHAAEKAKASAVLAAGNPFAHPSSLPYGAEPMGDIKDGDFEAALETGMEQERIEVEAIANNNEPPNFDNTIGALDRTGQLLGRVNNLFQQLLGANTNDTLDKINEKVAPELQAHQDEILLNKRLFQKVKKLYDSRDTLGLDAKQKYLLTWNYRHFVHAGAQLPQAKQDELKAINEKIATLSNDYRTKLMAANKEAALLVDDKAALDGLSDGELAAAAEAASKAGHEGKYLLAIRNTTQQPMLATLKLRATREKLMQASLSRGEHPGDADVRDLIVTIAQLRAQKAKLMGFKDYAAFVQAEQMAKTPEASKKLLIDLAPAAVHKAKTEAAEIQALIDKQGGGFKLASWDWQFYAEQVRKAKYDFDGNEVKQYFEIDKVLQDGVFFAANKMYGIAFKERHDIPTYHPDMRVFEVFDADGASLALFEFDPYARPNKNGGAWCTYINAPSGMDKRKPIIVNSLNFTKPANAGEPMLLSFDDVTAMFHEFGHALHAMFSVQFYPSQNGFAMPTDVIEFPSQFNEHWAMEPTVFVNYAKHNKTGAAMPQALVGKIKAARTYGKGYGTTEYVAAALLDLEWHSLAADAPKQDPDAFEAAALKKDGVDMPEVPPRYRSPYFLHIWANGYEANYYAYMWGEILDDDAYEWFVENGGMTRTNGQTFRDKMLGLGFTADPMDIYRGFRGRDPSAEAIKRERGLE